MKPKKIFFRSYLVAGTLRRGGFEVQNKETDSDDPRVLYVVCRRGKSVSSCHKTHSSTPHSRFRTRSHSGTPLSGLCRQQLIRDPSQSTRFTRSESVPVEKRNLPSSGDEVTTVPEKETRILGTADTNPLSDDTFMSEHPHTPRRTGRRRGTPVSPRIHTRK